MRISPILFLLPVLTASGACTQTVPSAIAVDDRPASPQPAIASPVSAPLTIESLAGTYKAVIDEQSLAGFLDEARRTGLDEEGLQDLAAFTRQPYDGMRVTINADGTFELQDPAFRGSRLHGKVKLDANKLILIDASDKPIKGTNVSTRVSTALTLDVAADGKYLLLYDPLTPSKLLRGYVKQ